jgi:protein-L-isoaspartate(D-aspartate) O-methyltransferase
MVDRQLRPRGISDESVLRAFMDVPRHLFVPDFQAEYAYGDYPLSIGFDQTISQPYMVAIMSQELRIRGGEKVLEIGTGSGFQSAVLARMGARVFTVERIAQLSERAGEAFKTLGFGSIVRKVGDGTLGWPGQAPFDRIIVTAGAPAVPEALKSQLAEGGILVIPVGSEYWQTLEIVERTPSGFETRSGTSCVFVRLKGKEGWPE